MRRLIISITLAGALAACGSDTSGTFEDEDGTRGSYEIDESTGETTATITTEDGTVNINAGAGVEADLPDGWALYPGAEVVTTTNASTDDGKATMVSFTTEDGPDKIGAFYREQAEKNGLKIEMEMKTGDGQMIAGSNDAGAGLSVISSPEGDKTVTQLSISENFGN